MAVVGRQKSYWYLAAQAEMLASISALPSTKNSFTSWSRVFPRMRDRAEANNAMWPGGNSDFGPSAQYSAFTLAVSERLEVSLRAVVTSLLSFGGPLSWN